MKTPQASLAEIMASKVKIANSSDVEKGKCFVARAPDGTEIALFRDDNNTICALENSCPHMGGPLGEGEVNGCTITCPWHGWQFDIKTGACQNMPGDDARTLKIADENGEVFLIE